MLHDYIIPDITKYIISDYIPHDELLQLLLYIPHLWANPARTMVYEYRGPDDNWDPNDYPEVITYNNYVDTEIDDVLRHRAQYELDGTLLCESNYDSDGAEHGEIKSWYADGQLYSQFVYVHGQMHGLQRRWHNNGVLRSESMYDHGVRVGKRRDWDENGVTH